MSMPPGWLPQGAETVRQYDEEGRLSEQRPGEQDGIASTNSRNATEAEEFSSCTPFLKKNKHRDAQRRNYVIQPGGACIYFKSEKDLEDPYGGGKVMFDQPTAQESFGHDTQPSAHPTGTAEVPFSRGRGMSGS